MLTPRQASQSRRIGNLYELLPNVFAREKTPERLRRPLESLHDVDVGSNLPGRSPARELGDRFPKAGGEGQDLPLSAHGAERHSFTGLKMGAPLAFSSTTTNRAGSVLLTFRPTT